MRGEIATAETTVHAGRDEVWAALTDPDRIAAYSGGARVTTSWRVGDPIIWSGEYNGHAFEDHGEVLVYDVPHVLSVTHYSPLMGQDDRPENYHTLVYTLSADGEDTRLSLVQDNCTDAAQAQQFGANWQATLDGLKEQVEQ